jgi:hypothetical protein
MNTNHPRSQRAALVRALGGSVLVAVITVALKQLPPRYVDAGIMQRWWGVLLATFIVINANAIPKAMSARAQARCAPAAEQATRRFVGWTMVLGGLAYGAAWVIAPLEQAKVLSAAFLGGALLLVLGRCAMRVVARRLA